MSRKDDGDDADRRVLASEVRRAFLHGAGDLLHPLGACRLLEDPPRQVQADGNLEERADQREQDCVVLEEVGHGCNETGRRAGPVAARSPRPGPETAARSFITLAPRAVAALERARRVAPSRRGAPRAAAPGFSG